MPVSRHQLYKELELKLKSDDEVTDNVADFGDEVARNWKILAREILDAGYWTGKYAASIKRKSVRAPKSEGGNRGGWKTTVSNTAKHAHFIEYGTDEDDAPNYPDPPNNGGHWLDPQGGKHVSPWTPTPVFAIAAQIEADYSETKAALPKSKLARRHIRDGTRASRSRLKKMANE